MSCYEWEQGTIKIPASLWASFRKGLLSDWNAGRIALLKKAKRAHAAAKAAIKGVRGHEKQWTAMDAAIREVCGLDMYGCSHEYQAVHRMILRRKDWQSPQKLVTPTAKSAGTVPVSKSTTLDLGDASVTFDNATKSVTWDVPENNHARDHARDHWFAKRLFAALGRVKWARGSGGLLVGNDEYNRDARDSGGGGNYTTAIFTPQRIESVVPHRY